MSATGGCGAARIGPTFPPQWAELRNQKPVEPGHPDCITLVAMHTWMRRSELVWLEWRHVGEDFVKVPGTETKRSKGVVPPTKEACDAIRSQPRRSE